ncbi:unnamed protein product [Rotaria magnacalcarata]|uniref:Uncharacterized protein n=1 Tax=Rotaria magnacalcarata TaxID=392030 RepID=A0A814QRA4_9BILA|nr:unnamed protein product [Rotaria magnacalcarata]CAF1595864.1 unnamed protein product [Rotaria magnacalcarata]CAF2229781.1 unnamed protein product [Rotaria magnacalcarata]CAF3797171.1 unnamed protein product [Rotaria magnacalcarata]CAF3801463.1 unnamed protein product [Rotaria magnacalcarata]
MNSQAVSSNFIDELRNKLKQHPNVPIEAELDILKPMVPVHIWKNSSITKDDYAVRIARLVWLIWKEVHYIWPDFHLNDYCLLFDLESTDKEFYYINKDVGEIYKYPKKIDLQIDPNLSQTIKNDFHSRIFIQYHSNENFLQRKFVWHQDWIPDYQLKERHYEDDFEFFKDNICLGQFSYATALLIREWLAAKHKEYHIHMEKLDFRHKFSSFIQGANQADKYVNYLPSTDIQRLHIELSNSLCCAILNFNDHQVHLNDALARLTILKTEYAKEWYDNNWYCSYNDGLLRYLMLSVSLHGTFAMNLNLKSNIEYYQVFIRHSLTECNNPSKGRVYELASIQLLTAILCDLGGEDPDIWKQSYNGKILHTLLKHGLNSSTIKPELHDSAQIESFFTESIIQSYHHFSLFAKQIHQKGSKFLILPNESNSMKTSNLSYYAPAMKYLLDGHMWTKYVHHLDYSSEYGIVKLCNILIGEICLVNHHIFIVPLLHNAIMTNNNRLIIHYDQIEINIVVNQQENYLNNRHIYFVVDSHKQNDYSNIFVRPIESSNNCVLF